MFVDDSQIPKIVDPRRVAVRPRDLYRIIANQFGIRENRGPVDPGGEDGERQPGVCRHDGFFLSSGSTRRTRTPFAEKRQRIPTDPAIGPVDAQAFFAIQMQIGGTECVGGEGLLEGLLDQFIFVHITLCRVV